jgi:hypothetical protein
MDEFQQYMLYCDSSPILAFNKAFSADYRRHIAFIVSCDWTYVMRKQNELEEAMEELKETWDCEEMITSIELTGTYAEFIHKNTRMSQMLLQCVPYRGPLHWHSLYHDACLRYGQAATQRMYPLIDGRKTLGSMNYQIAREAFEAKLMGKLKPTYAEVLKRGTES